MKHENLEAIYRLSPMQEGILFHVLAEPEAGLYFLQFGLELRGPLDLPALRRAWEETIERHAALRTTFHWQGLEKPVQVVSRRVELPWEERDWQEAPPRQRPRSAGRSCAALTGSAASTCLRHPRSA